MTPSAPLAPLSRAALLVLLATAARAWVIPPRPRPATERLAAVQVVPAAVDPPEPRALVVHVLGRPFAIPGQELDRAGAVVRPPALRLGDLEAEEARRLGRSRDLLAGRRVGRVVGRDQVVDLSQGVRGVARFLHELLGGRGQLLRPDGACRDRLRTERDDHSGRASLEGTRLAPASRRQEGPSGTLPSASMPAQSAPCSVVHDSLRGGWAAKAGARGWAAAGVSRLLRDSGEPRHPGWPAHERD